MTCNGDVNDDPFKYENISESFESENNIKRVVEIDVDTNNEKKNNHMRTGLDNTVYKKKSIPDKYRCTHRMDSVDCAVV